MNIEALYLAIKDETLKYKELIDMVGKDHPMSKRYCIRIFGMQEAFKIVSGISYTDYMLSKLSQEDLNMNIRNYNVALHEFCVMALTTFVSVFFMLTMCIAFM